MSTTEIVPASTTAFDERPIELPGFHFRARALDIVGRPKIRDWQRALTFAAATHEAAPYWLGSLLVYAESREDWRKKLSQAISVSGLAQGTLENYATLVRSVAEPERMLAPTVTHAQEVAKLDADEQREALTEAAEKGLTTRELRQHVKNRRRNRLMAGQAEGIFSVELTVQATVRAADELEAEHLVRDWAAAALKEAATGSKIQKPKIGRAHV